MRLVDDVHGDAAPGPPPGQLGMVDDGLTGDGDRFVGAAEADEAGGPRARQLDPGRRAGLRTHGVGDLQRLGRPPGAGEEAGAAGVDGRDLLRVAQPLPRRLVGGQRAVEVAPHVEPGVGQAASQVGPLGVGQRLVPHTGDDLLDGVVPTLHGVRLDQHLGALTRLDGAVVGRVHESRGQHGVVADQGQPRGLEEAVTRHPAARGDAPHRHLDHVLAAPRAAGLDEVGQLLLDAAPPQGRQPLAQHLAVQRVGQAHRGATPRRHERHEAARLEGVQRRRTVGGLEIGEAEPLAHGQQLEHGEAGVVDPGQVLGDELLQRRRRRQRPGEVPHAPGVEQRASFPGRPHELGEHLEVAAGQPGQLGERVRRHRAVEGPVQQRAELSLGQRRQVQTHDVAVALEGAEPRRRGVRRSYGAQQEHRPGHDEWDQYGDRCLVEQVEVVDHQDEALVAGQPAELGSGVVEQGRALVRADAQLEEGGRRQEVGERAEGDRRRRRVADRPLDPVPRLLGEAQRLLGQTGLADTGRAEQHDASTGAFPELTADLLQLCRAPGQRPRSDHHGA